MAIYISSIRSIIIPLIFLPICYIVCKIVIVMNITVILRTWLLLPSNLWRGSHGHDLDLQLPMQSVTITSNVVSDAYSKHVHVIMFVSDLRQVDDFLWVFRNPLPIKKILLIFLVLQSFDHDNEGYSRNTSYTLNDIYLFIWPGQSIHLISPCDMNRHLIDNT